MNIQTLDFQEYFIAVVNTTLTSNIFFQIVYIYVWLLGIMKEQVCVEKCYVEQ